MPLNDLAKVEFYKMLDDYFESSDVIEKKFELLKSADTKLKEKEKKYETRFKEKTLKEWISVQADKRLPGKRLRAGMKDLSERFSDNPELQKQFEKMSSSLSKAGGNIMQAGRQSYSAGRKLIDPVLQTLIQSNPVLYLMAQVAGPALGLAKGAFSLAKGGVNAVKGLAHGIGGIGEGVYSLLNTRKKVTSSQQQRADNTPMWGGSSATVLDTRKQLTASNQKLLTTSLPMLPGPKQDDGIIDLVPDASGVFRAKGDHDRQRLLTDNKKKQNLVQKTLASISKNTLAATRVLGVLSGKAVLIASGIGLIALAALGLFAWLKNRYGTPPSTIYDKNTKDASGKAGALNQASSLNNMNLDTQMQYLRKLGKGVSGSSKGTASYYDAVSGKFVKKPVMNYTSSGMTPVVAPVDGMVMSVQPIFKGSGENQQAVFKLVITSEEAITKQNHIKQNASVEPLISVNVSQGQHFVKDMVLGYADKSYRWQGLEKLYSEDYGEFINKHAGNNFADVEKATRGVMTPEYIQQTLQNQNQRVKQYTDKAKLNQRIEASPAVKAGRALGWYKDKIQEDISGSPTGGAAPVSSMNQATKNGQKIADQSNNIQRTKNAPINKGSGKVNTDGTKSKKGATGIQTASTGIVFSNNNEQLASVSAGNVFGITNC